MSARKGIKKAIAEWLIANPTTEVTGREIEDMYIAHGGAVNGKDYPKSRRGRVQQDTMRRLIQGLPVKKVSDGTRGRGGLYGQGVERATYVYHPKPYWGKPTVHPSGLVTVDLITPDGGTMSLTGPPSMIP